VLAALSSVVPPRLPWISLYWVFAVVTLVTILLLAATRFPKVERTDEERVGTWATQKRLFRNRTVLLYFVSMFAYVGTEQGTADWMSKFLSTYHGYDPQTAGANAVSWFWGLLTAGCLLGMLLLRLFDSRKVLIVSAALSMVVLTGALVGPGRFAIIAFPVAGFTISVMWPVIVSLGLNSVAEHHGSVSGILCTAICGGAVVPLVIGRLGDYAGLRAGMMFLYLTLGWVLSIGFWARPIVTNKTFAVGTVEGGAG
jgi:fucose permease